MRLRLPSAHVCYSSIKPENNSQLDSQNFEEVAHLFHPRILRHLLDLFLSVHQYGSLQRICCTARTRSSINGACIQQCSRSLNDLQDEWRGRKRQWSAVFRMADGSRARDVHQFLCPATRPYVLAFVALCSRRWSDLVVYQCGNESIQAIVSRYVFLLLLCPLFLKKYLIFPRFANVSYIHHRSCRTTFRRVL